MAKKKQDLADFKLRTDAYVNTYTGLGDSNRDKLAQTIFSGSSIIGDQTLEDLYHNNDLAARICEALPEESLRQGYELKIGEDEYSDELKQDRLAPVNPADLEMAKQIVMKLDGLSAREKLVNAMVWGRVFGAGILYVGIDDGQAPEQPLDEERIQSIQFIVEIDRRDLTPDRMYSDPSTEKFGTPETYLLSTTKDGQTLTATIHESRLIMFEGARTSRRRRNNNAGGWADSVLVKVEDVLTQFGVSWQATAHLMTDAAQGVFKMTGLVETLRAQSPDWVKARMAQMDMNRSVARMLVVDADSNEDFKRDTYSFNGIPQILELFMLRLSAAARIPVTILMGQSPAGMNATGESDMRWFYDTVKSFQKYQVKPALEKLVRWCFLAKDGPTKGQEPDHWAVCFPSPWQLSEMEEAEIELKKAQASKARAESALIMKSVTAPAPQQPTNVESQSRQLPEIAPDEKT